MGKFNLTQLTAFLISSLAIGTSCNNHCLIEKSSRPPIREMVQDEKEIPREIKNRDYLSTQEKEGVIYADPLKTIYR